MAASRELPSRSETANAPHVPKRSGFMDSFVKGAAHVVFLASTSRLNPLGCTATAMCDSASQGTKELVRKTSLYQSLIADGDVELVKRGEKLHAQLTHNGLGRLNKLKAQDVRDDDW